MSNTLKQTSREEHLARKAAARAHREMKREQEAATPKPKPKKPRTKIVAKEPVPRKPRPPIDIDKILREAEMEEAAGAYFPDDPGMHDDKFVATEAFNVLAEKCLKKDINNADLFRALCRTALAEGIVSRQELRQEFGKGALPCRLETDFTDWNVPKPDVARNILEFFIEADSEHIMGEVTPWRHAASEDVEAKSVYPVRQHVAKVAGP